MRYRLRNNEVDAIKFDRNDIDEILTWIEENFKYRSLNTEYGWITVEIRRHFISIFPGEYLVKFGMMAMVCSEEEFKDLFEEKKQ